MKKSVVYTKKETYRITITSDTERENKFLEKPIKEIEPILHQYFDQAVKESLGENASISTIIDDSGLPYEILAHISYNDKQI